MSDEREYKPFDAKVLEANRLYQPTLEVMWQARLADHYKELDRGLPDHDTASRHLGNGMVGLFGALSWMTGFEPVAVIKHMTDVGFDRWMASPEGIAHNEMIKNKGK